MSLSARIAAYDREAAAAASASAPASVAAPPSDDAHDPPPFCASSSTASQSDASSSQDELLPAATSTDAPLDAPPCRVNEHLAVLIPRDLWKPDRLASHCDKYACRVRFSLFERKHHCRKCGGVFCQQCSARATSLLDTTRLPFLLPPRGTPITAHAAPHAPIHVARVCDDCYEQLHGYPTPRPPSPQPVPVALANSSSSLSSLSPATPPDGRPVLPRPSTYAHYPRPVKTTKLAGDLDRYPLKDPSATCKAAGGGRWSPTPIPQRWDAHARLPDGRIRIDAHAERRAEAKRQQRANPVIVDGHGLIRVRPPPRRGNADAPYTPPPRPTF